MARRLYSVVTFGPLLFAIASCVSPARGQLAFTPLATYPTGQNPQYVAVGDLNGDKSPDAVVVNTSSNSISVFINKHDGTGALLAPVSYTVGTLPTWAAIADFNGDGKLDVAVTNCSAGTISILLGNGDGTLQAQTVVYPMGATTATSPAPVAVAVGDVNGDAKPDLVVANSATSTVSVLINNGKGGFTFGSSVTVGTSPDAVALAQFTGSGNLDIVTSNKSGRNVSIAVGKGDGTFQPAKSFPAGYVPFSVAPCDYDGDGKVDVAVCDNMSLASGVNILKGNGDGTLGSPTLFTGGKNPVAVVVGDFNADGRQDLATVNNGTQDVSAFLNNGSLSFSSPITLAPATTHLGAGVGDFDGDGTEDLILANAPSGVTVLVNVTASISSLLVAPNSIMSGNSTIATVKLNRSAPAGGVLVSLKSSNTNVAWVPADLLIPAGSISASFHISSTAGYSGLAYITASYMGVTVQDELTVNPVPNQGLKGDINGDGKTDVLDITALARIVAGLDPMR